MSLKRGENILWTAVLIDHQQSFIMLQSGRTMFFLPLAIILLAKHAASRTSCTSKLIHLRIRLD